MAMTVTTVENHMRLTHMFMAIKIVTILSLSKRNHEARPNRQDQDSAYTLLK